MESKQKKKKPKETKNRLSVARGMGKQVGEIGKINVVKDTNFQAYDKSWGFYVQRTDNS